VIDMHTIRDVAQFLNVLAPPALAESWDNVGLLVGRNAQPIERLMTCLTVTPDSAAEAIERRANLIVSHHPLPFRPLKRVTCETSEGRLLLDLIGAGIAVFSAHTAFDSAERGINQQWAERLQLRNVAPLLPAAEPGQGAGRCGQLEAELSLAEWAARVKQLLALEHVQAAGRLDARVRGVAVACGSAGEFLGPTQAAGCDCLVTGEVRFHTCLEAESLGVGLILVGHFASERFGVEQLAAVLAEAFPALQVWASQREKDPLRWL
jgi:dinuclear metal center YbgI/SA1388 family protein